MEPEMSMPITLIGHVAKHCNHVVNSSDENNNIIAMDSHYPTSMVIPGDELHLFYTFFIYNKTCRRTAQLAWIGLCQ